ncbi:MAG: hypothetical protein V4658_09270 [Bacteroidota bacterium]
MKLLVLLFTAALFQKSNAQYVTLMCGHNQVRLDSSVNLSCNFFTDSLVKIYMDKPYKGSRFQVALFPEKGLPAMSWYTIDPYTREATIKWTGFLKEGCVKGKWFIMYQKKEVNIQNYIINVEL